MICFPLQIGEDRMDDDAGFVGNIPQFYDQGLGPVIFVDAAADMARRAAALQPRRVLETAAGTGIVSRALRDALPAEAHLTVTDLNPPMLDVAKRKFAVGEAVSFQPADATDLPFADDSFDVVVCQFGVMFYPDKDKGYREVLRVLAPGGHYLFSVWDSHRNNAYGRIAHETVGKFFPDDPPQFQRVPFSYPFDPIKDSLVATGFSKIQAFVLTIEKEVADLDLFARGIVYGNPLYDQIRSRGKVDPEDVVAALVEAFGAAFGTPRSRVRLQTLLFSAAKPG